VLISNYAAGRSDDGSFQIDLTDLLASHLAPDALAGDVRIVGVAAEVDATPFG